MRVLHVAPRLSDRGGADRCLLATLGAQVRAGAGGLHLAVGHDDGTGHAPCPVTRVRGLDARGDAPGAVAALDALGRALRPDVLHVHHVVSPDVLRWAGSRGAVVSVQDHRVFCPGRGKWKADDMPCREPMGETACRGCFEDPAYHASILRLTQARLAALSGAEIVVLSRYMRAELVLVGLDPSRVHVVPPFVDGLDLSAAPDGPPCVLFAGRLVRAKGVADAVEAWRRAATGLPLVFAGTGPLRGDLEAAGLEVRGWLDRRRLSATYARAAALLLPSRWQEPFGLVGLEALACGVPVVAWDAGGVSEWHPGAGLVRWGDVDGLAAALREAVGRRASAPPGYDAEGFLRRLGGVYGRALHGPGARGWPPPA